MTETIVTYPDFSGKVAGAIGGSGGIGAATCRMLIASGAKVTVNGRDEARIGVSAEVTDYASIERMPKRVEEERYMTEDQVRRWAEAFPLRRMGTPDDAALATLYLASENSSWLTGVTLDVAGGKIML
jgi:NAD(P)-dependent dehydrogenase (short-subunit alcohol dehydrogenase family)